MLETLWHAHKNNPGHPISGFKTNVFGLGIPHCGTCNLDKLEYYGDLFNYLSEELFEMYSSDIFFTYMAARAGHPHVWCGRNYITERNVFDEIAPLEENTNAGYDGLNKMYTYLTNKYGHIRNSPVVTNDMIQHLLNIM